MLTRRRGLAWPLQLSEAHCIELAVLGQRRGVAVLVILAQADASTEQLELSLQIARPIAVRANWHQLIEQRAVARRDVVRRNLHHSHGNCTALSADDMPLGCADESFRCCEKTNLRDLLPWQKGVGFVRTTALRPLLLQFSPESQVAKSTDKTADAVQAVRAMLKCHTSVSTNSSSSLTRSDCRGASECASSSALTELPAV